MVVKKVLKQPTQSFPIRFCFGCLLHFAGKLSPLGLRWPALLTAATGSCVPFFCFLSFFSSFFPFFFLSVHRRFFGWMFQLTYLVNPSLNPTRLFHQPDQRYSCSNRQWSVALRNPKVQFPPQKLGVIIWVCLIVDPFNACFPFLSQKTTQREGYQLQPKAGPSFSPVPKRHWGLRCLQHLFHVQTHPLTSPKSCFFRFQWVSSGFPENPKKREVPEHPQKNERRNTSSKRDRVTDAQTVSDPKAAALGRFAHNPPSLPRAHSRALPRARSRNGCRSWRRYGTPGWRQGSPLGFRAGRSIGFHRSRLFWASRPGRRFPGQIRR